DAGQQVLILVPEISLTPQLLARFERRFAEPITVLHSGLGNTERLHRWRAVREGQAKILIGTRSAVFAAMPDLGLIIVDEEHDSSLKQQEGFRYSARDLAVVRARSLDVPIVMGTATPALETLNNALSGKYQLLHLRNRAGGALPPTVELIDLRTEPSHQGLSTRLVDRATQHLRAGGQVLFFLNRRGFAPTWYCNQCGWMADCRHCDARLTYHRNTHSLRCHHCAAVERVPECCPQCDAELQPVGQGTERIENELARTFPDFKAARMDRDVVRTREDLERFLDQVNSGEIKILVGTQMLAKGHHFPNVTLVAILNADQGLFGIDFRSTEKLAQTIVQVAGRAGRADKPGQVLIQTSFPEHPLLQTLINDGYEAFTLEALKDREQTRWPPYSHLAMLRVRSKEQHKTMGFLRAVKQQHAALAAQHQVTILGPVVAPMARRAGQQHGQLLLQSQDRARLNAVLATMCHQLTEAPPVSGVRWSLDVDPIELF
ncbi:MAG: primosomal protein N', partial [Gammaproteobacteria bacterium]|nr:primosomal protein N' [Gammaproteobacteria bacterium]